MLTILMGKSAVGKDTVQNELMKNADFERVVTATTRSMREGEQDGVDYHFMSDEQFKEDAANDKFIEHTEFNGVSYGSPKSSVDLEKDMCIILEPEGVQSFIDVFGKENLFVVSLELDDETRKERAIERGSFDEDKWNSRLQSDYERFDKETVDKLANYTVDVKYFDPEELCYDIVNALEEYEKADRSGEKIVVTSEVYSSYYQPPEWEYYARTETEHKARLEQAEKESYPTERKNIMENKSSEATVELYLRGQQVFDFAAESTSLADIRKNAEYRDYIECCQQYIDCEENPSTAILPHNLVIKATDGNEEKSYNTTVESESRMFEKEQNIHCELIVSGKAVQFTNEEVNANTLKSEVEKGVKQVLDDYKNGNYSSAEGDKEFYISSYVDLSVNNEEKTFFAGIHEHSDGFTELMTIDEETLISTTEINKDSDMDKMLASVMEDFEFVLNDISFDKKQEKEKSTPSKKTGKDDVVLD